MLEKIFSTPEGIVAFFVFLQALLGSIVGFAMWYLDKPSRKVALDAQKIDSTDKLLATTERFSIFIERLISQRDDQDRKIDAMGKQVQELVSALQIKNQEVTDLNQKIGALEQDYKKQIGDLETKHAAELVALRDQLTKQHQTEMGELKKNHAAEMKLLQENHSKEQAQLRDALEQAQEKITALEDKLKQLTPAPVEVVPGEGAQPVTETPEPSEAKG